jgi:putative ABC transport system permease protein
MLTSYATTAARALKRRPGLTALNVAGLAVGLAACLLIGRYVADAWRADRFHAHADRIVHVTSHLNVDGDPVHFSTSQGPFAPALEAEVPSVEAAVRFISGGYRLQRGATQAQVDALPFVDASVFDVFSFRLLRGDPATALAAPNALVLTPALARQFFGDADPMGQTLDAADGPTLTVTGVVAAPPPTSHLQFDGLVSMATRRAFDAERFGSWGRFSYWTYVLLTPEASPEAFAEALPGVVARHMPPAWHDALRYEVTPLTDVYLHGGGLFPLGPRGDATALRIFLAVAAFILAIAVINFVNLATARATERAKEVGVRKALGAPRSALVGQFLAEAVLTALLALGVALVVARTALPLFHALADTTLAGGLVPNAAVTLALGGGAVAVGLLAGAYPALMLAGYRPVRVLRGAFGASREGQTLRRTLVVTQFAIAIALLASTGVVQQQLAYVQSRDLGFAPSQLVALNFRQDEEVNRQREVLKQALAQVPGVEAVAASTYVPGRGHDVTGFEVEGPDGTMRDVKANRFDVDLDFIATYGLDVRAGRAFDPAVSTDSTGAVLVNAAAARHFGYTDPAAVVGRTLTQGDEQPTPFTVVGVVEDFHYGSLHARVEPLVILPQTAWGADAARYLTLRVATGDPARTDLARTMDAVQARWDAVVPDRPFEASFLDQTFADLYAQDRRFGRLFGVFGGLAILVAGLGLFGLATHTVQQRTKEIGIRKVLGATAASLVALLARDFARLVALAFLVGGPVAYLGMRRWLDGFAYRVDLGPGVFALAGAVALAVALATVGTQAYRAARADPVSAIRDE